ncbi:cell wall elongation regulator TseB-like domain-containing protein [Virgibacillus profundi]|uniref:cell wall elongation regulator TseB-like domain-containing protein n=1 Tax=Virgibacillus profundi TaxID=2024555 RepID=UPI001F0AABA1|nr:DUF5590 domain-containing protein [Virgibacillus profundi]
MFLYNDLASAKTAGYDETKKQILENTSITNIDKIEQFNGAASYHVIFGENKDDEKKLIFYPLKGNEKDLTTIDQHEIMPKKEVLGQWNEQCKDCNLVNIVPALVDEKVLWEVTYENNSNQYIIDYLDIHDGTRYEQYRFNRTFK